MSGSELGRLMHEVTAQPPVEVDFGAVEHLVRRRQRRLRSAAGGAAVAAVAVIIAVPVLGGMADNDRHAQQSAPGVPGRTDTWNTLSWVVPSDWPASDAYPDHSRPSNAFIDGPYIGSARVPMAPPTPRPTQGSGVLASAAPTLPAGAVVGWFSYGLRADPLTPASFDADAMTYLPARCAAMGAAHTFHAVRQFGTAAAGSNLALDGCINAADPSTQEAQLAAVLASVKDSAYAASSSAPSSAVVSPGPTPPTSWPAGGLSWVTPSGWIATDKQVPDTTIDLIKQQNGPLLSTVRLNPACTDVLAGFSCDNGQPIAALGSRDAIAELSVSPSSNIEGDTGQFYPADDDGSFASAGPTCARIGGRQMWTWSHLYGPRSNARLVRLSACMAASGSADRTRQLHALTSSVQVKEFPDLRAGTEHPIPRPASSSAAPMPATVSGVASGTTAAALCRSALGTYSTASLTTVGDLRSIEWGPAYKPLPHVFKGAPASDTAAWCWKARAGTADIYVAHAGDKAVFVIGDGIGPGPVPSGVPRSPEDSQVEQPGGAGWPARVQLPGPTA